MADELTVTFRQHVRPEHAGEYCLLPFEVPTDAARIDVQLRYDQAILPVTGAPAGNTIDLGLFDSRGAAFADGSGFRGWSGSARNDVFVAPDDASPSYLPGPLYAGTWNVLLGIYKVHPEGCNYQVTVRVTRGPAPAPVQTAWPVPPVKREERWYRGDLHCHSNHSEATGTLAELCGSAVAQGLDYLAVTEHNTISHHRLLGQFHTTDFLPIPGEEVTTYLGHANVWGTERWIDFRCRRDADLARVVSMAHAAGALFSANHPKTNGPEWQYGSFAGIDCLEVWQGPWFLSNYQSLAKWDAMLRNGMHVPAVGGSDQHQPAATDAPGFQRVGQPTTWAFASELTQEAILAAIKAGHVFISATPAGPRLELRAQAEGHEAIMGDVLTVSGRGPVQLEARVQGGKGLVLRLVGARGIMAEAPIENDDFRFPYELATRVSTYVRAEVAEPLDPADANEPAALMLQALGNPIYVHII